VCFLCVFVCIPARSFTAGLTAMTDAVSSSLAARLLPAVPFGTYEAFALPYTVLVLSMVLLTTSFFRRVLERSIGRRSKLWARQTLALPRNHMEVAEVQHVDARQQELSSREDKQRRRRTQRRKRAQQSALESRAVIHEAAEPMTSEPEDQAVEEGAAQPGCMEAALEEELKVPAVASPACEEAAPVEELPEEQAPAEEPSDAVPEAIASMAQADEQCPCSVHSCWGSEEHQVYSNSLLLAHRELHLHIRARGAPGLPPPLGLGREASEQPRGSSKPATITSKKPGERSPGKAPQPAVILALEAVQAMPAPDRKCKIVVADTKLTIHINADQNRYQVYCSGVEM